MDTVCSSHEKVVANNVTTFEVAVAKGSTTETLVFDKDGKFMNKLAVKTGAPEKPKSTRVTHKPVPKKKVG